MRTAWWGCIVAGVLVVCWGVYQHVSRPSSPVGPPEASEQAERRPVNQRPAPPVADTDENRPQQADAASLGLEPDQSPNAQQEARLEEAPAAVSSERTEHAERRPLDPKPEQAVANKDESRLQQADAAPSALEPDQAPEVQKEARLDDATGAATIEHSEPSDTKRRLSYLHYYAYSDLPPEIKLADIVMDRLKDIPSGTPIEEIRRVADVLGLDFIFMKSIARIESGFDPKQRTGSYIGLFQMSRYEFKKYGSGEILVARDNAVSAALKMVTEAAMFELFTAKKASLFDQYLIHQQGLGGATQHISQPNRLAWRSMCRTGEGKQKGEKWCKRAIWGNTLPAFKRTWKSVNKVTSGAFIAMWQQRVAHFYGRYSQAAMAH
jgi:hypothetical protein